MLKKHLQVYKFVLSVIVALSLSVSSFSASEFLAARQTALSFAYAADNYSTVVLDKTLWQATTAENEEIVLKATQANVVGSEALKLYLAGETVDAAAFKNIDTQALASIDADLASVIASEQARIAKAQKEAAETAAASESAQQNASNSAQQQTQASGTEQQVQTNSADQASATDTQQQNVVVEDAPEGVEQKTESAQQDEETGAISVSPNPTTEEFIASIGEDARELCQKADLYASVMIAQAVIESASGSSGLAKEPYYNLFGIKGSYNGSSVRMKTQEDDGAGNYSTITAEFRKYPSKKESLQDYVSLLTNNSLYEPAKKSHTSSYVDTCDYLQGRYATSSTYSKTLQAYISAYNLTEYDSPAANKTTNAEAADDSTLKASADGKSPTYTSYAYASNPDEEFSDITNDDVAPTSMLQLVVGIALVLLFGSAAFYMYWLRKNGKTSAVEQKLALACTNATTNIKNLGNKLNGLEPVSKPSNEKSISGKHAKVTFGKHAK